MALAEGRGTSAIALDRGGTTHYAFATGGHVRHLVEEAPERWSTEGAGVASPSYGARVLMAIDAGDQEHLAFAGTEGSVGYASKLDDRWTSRSLAQSGTLFSLVAGSEGVAHLALRMSSPDGATLQYWTATPSSLAGETLGTDATSASLAFGPNGSAQVAFVHRPTGLLGFARQENGWQQETVLIPSNGVTPLLAASGLAVDASNLPHLAFVYGENVLYAERDPLGAWSITGVSDLLPNGGPFLALATNGTAHVLVPLQGQRMALVTFEPPSMTTLPFSGFPSDFRLDAAGATHVAYQTIDDGLGTFRYATNRTVVADSVDADCDGVDGVDLDRDGFASNATGGTDCDDADPNRNPQALEVPGDGVDDDCDGVGACARGLPGPTLVDVPWNDDSGSGDSSFCIDATEVTNADYARFLEVDLPLLSGPPGGPFFCSFNGTAVPGERVLDVIGDLPCPVFDPDSRPEHPVVCVDWCDAWAYCRWAGKRLCGTLNGYPDPGVAPLRSEWVNACTAGGRRAFPYGLALEPGRCVDAAFSSLAEPQPVRAAAGCEGGIPGLFDMSGNVREWIDDYFEPGASSALDAYRPVGGSFLDSGNELACLGPTMTARRGDVAADLGFRCCSD